MESSSSFSSFTFSDLPLSEFILALETLTLATESFSLFMRILVSFSSLSVEITSVNSDEDEAVSVGISS